MKQKKYLMIMIYMFQRRVFEFQSLSGHSESVYFEVDKEDVTVEDIRSALMENAPGIVVQDDPKTQSYPMPLFSEGKDDVFVGRLRKDPDHPAGFHMWVVTDNLIKGAALNSVQIAEVSWQLRRNENNERGLINNGTWTNFYGDGYSFFING